MTRKKKARVSSSPLHNLYILKHENRYRGNCNNLFPMLFSAGLGDSDTCAGAGSDSDSAALTGVVTVAAAGAVTAAAVSDVAGAGAGAEELKVISDATTKNTNPRGPALHPSLLQRQQAINRRTNRVLPPNILCQAERLPRRRGVDRRDRARAQEARARARGVEGRQAVPELRARCREVRHCLFPREDPARDQEAFCGCVGVRYGYGGNSERADVCGRDVAHIDEVWRELHRRCAPFHACDERVHHPVRACACGARRCEALDKRAVDEWRVDYANVYGQNH